MAVLEADLSGSRVKETSETAVSEVMSPIEVTVNTGDSLAKALFLMVKEDLGRMPVMQDKKVGAVGKLPADFDLDSAVSDLEADLSGPGVKEAAQTAVSEVMNPIEVTVDTGDSLAKALFLMIKEDLGRMPVMEEHRVVGIVRLSDLFQEIADFVLSE